MNCSRHTTYFHLRIVFLVEITVTRHIELFQAHQNIPFGHRFSNRWIVPGAQRINFLESTWGLFFTREIFQNCSRRSTNIPLGNCVSYAMNFSRHTAFSTLGSLFKDELRLPQNLLISTCKSFSTRWSVSSKPHIPFENRFLVRWFVSGKDFNQQVPFEHLSACGYKSMTHIGSWSSLNQHSGEAQRWISWTASSQTSRRQVPLAVCRLLRHYIVRCSKYCCAHQVATRWKTNASRKAVEKRVENKSMLIQNTRFRGCR